MKTLIIAPFSPYPVVFGGATRLYHLIKMFSTISDVTLLAYRSWSENGDNIGDLKNYCRNVVLISKPEYMHNKTSIQLQSLMSRKTFQYLSHYSDVFQSELDTLTKHEQFDYYVTSFSQMGWFQYPADRAVRILDLHNIEYELLARRASRETQLVKKAALALEALKFKREERNICKTFELIFAPSEREAETLRRALAPIDVEALPNSIDIEYFAPRTSAPAENNIVFVGTTHVDANRDGLCYFMEQIFPLIEARVPDIHFTIVGGSPPPEIRRFGERPNVTVTGYVKDVRPYMARAKALVVPLRVGGGTRLKILEGLSFGIPTVSTTLGSEGIEAEHGEHILLGDSPPAFAEHVIHLLSDGVLQARLSRNGRQLVEQKYSWQAVGAQLKHYLEKVRSARQNVVTSR